MHLFEERVYIKSGEPYFARWTSNSTVEVIVSKDFSLEGNFDKRLSGSGLSVHFIRLKDSLRSLF